MRDTAGTQIRVAQLRTAGMRRRVSVSRSIIEEVVGQGMARAYFDAAPDPRFMSSTYDSGDPFCLAVPLGVGERSRHDLADFARSPKPSSPKTT